MRKKAILFAIVTGSILVSLFFYRQVFFGEVWYCCDNLLINIPARVFQIEEIRKGRFPLINPYIFSGTQFLADINLAPLYPGNVVFALINNPFQALTVSILAHFIVAFVGMYFVGSFLGQSRTGQLVSAIVFTFSGTMITYTNNLAMLQVASLLPWVFWAWIGLLTRPTFARVLVFVFFASLQIFAGHPQFTYYTWLLLLAWITWFLRQRRIRLWRRPKKIWPTVGALVLVILITSVQVIPFLRFAAASTRSTFGYEYAVYDSLHPLAIIRLFVPWSVGILSEGTAWVMGGSVYGYVGVIPLILVLIAPRRKSAVRFLLIVALLSFIAALGKYTPLYPILYRIVPRLGTFRSPQHFLLLWTFAVAILAGFGSPLLSHGRKSLVIAATCMVAVALLILIVFGTHLFDPLFPQKLVAKFAIDVTVRLTIMRLIVVNAGLSAIILSLFYKFRNRFVLCILLFADLFIFTQSNITTVSASTVTLWFHTSDAFVKTITPESKIYVHKDLYRAPIHKQFGKNQLPDEIAWQIAILRPNINMLYHLPSIDGYASMVFSEYQASFGLSATDPTGVNVGQISGEKLFDRGVKTVLAPPDPTYIKELYPLMLSEWQPTMAIYRLARK